MGKAKLVNYRFVTPEEAERLRASGAPVDVWTGPGEHVDWMADALQAMYDQAEGEERERYGATLRSATRTVLIAEVVGEVDLPSAADIPPSDQLPS